MSVDDIRKKIDGLDNSIHDLLMERAELVLKIGEEKRKNKIQVIQPDREIIMLRRLLSRHKGPLPREAIVRIWRELVGAVSLLQTGLKVAVTTPGGSDDILYWDMAKDYFSSVLPMEKVLKPLLVLSMVRDEKATFGVMPWPNDGARDAKDLWWPYLMDDEGNRPMRIVARLPLGDRTKSPVSVHQQALVVARLKFEPSGDDRSFIMLDVEQGISRARLTDKARESGMALRNFYSATGRNPGRNFHLLEVKGYISADNSVLDTFVGLLNGAGARACVVGGYPVPPVYEDTVGKGADNNQLS